MSLSATIWYVWNICIFHGEQEQLVRSTCTYLRLYQLVQETIQTWQFAFYVIFFRLHKKDNNNINKVG